MKKIIKLITVAFLLVLGASSNAQTNDLATPKSPIRTQQDSLGKIRVLVWETTGLPCQVFGLNVLGPIPEGSVWRVAPENWDIQNPTPITPPTVGTAQMEEGVVYQVLRKGPAPDSELTKKELKLRKKMERKFKKVERKWRKKRIKDAKEARKRLEDDTIGL